jgi:hypothetical protein
MNPTSCCCAIPATLDEVLAALAAQIEKRFAEGRKRVDRITQAILAKAFRGELVPTEFELAKAEGRPFESAEERLERIRRNGNVGESEPSNAIAELNELADNGRQ